MFATNKLGVLAGQRIPNRAYINSLHPALLEATPEPWVLQQVPGPSSERFPVPNKKVCKLKLANGTSRRYELVKAREL